MRCPRVRSIIPQGSDLLLQPADFRQQGNQQADLLQDQRCFIVGTRVKVGNTLGQFIQRLLNARLIGWPMMKCIIDVADSIIQ